MQSRNDLIDTEVNNLAANRGLLTEEVEVLDLDNLPKQKHHWTHYGLTHICKGGTHPRHVYISAR